MTYFAVVHSKNIFYSTRSPARERSNRSNQNVPVFLSSLLVSNAAKAIVPLPSLMVAIVTVAFLSVVVNCELPGD